MKEIHFKTKVCEYKHCLISGLFYKKISSTSYVHLDRAKYNYGRLEVAKENWLKSLPKVQHIKCTKTYIITYGGKKYTYIRGCEIPFMHYGMYASERPALFDDIGDLVDYDSKELNKVIEAFKDWKWTYNL